MTVSRRRITVSPYVQPGAFYVMADYSHPEAAMTNFGMDAQGRITSTPGPDPDGSIVVCAPEDEQMIRDVLAMLGEHEDVGQALTRARRQRR